MSEIFLRSFGPTIEVGAIMMLLNFPCGLLSNKAGNTGVWLYTFGLIELVIARAIS